MSIEAEFLALMSSTVTVYAQASIDQYGKRSWSGTGTTYTCRLQDTNELLRDAEGRELVVTGKAYIYGAPAVTTDHKIVLPDGSSPVIHAVTINRDEAGDHHTVIYYGRG